MAVSAIQIKVICLGFFLFSELTWCDIRLFTMQSMWVVLPSVTVCTDPLVPGWRKTGRGGEGGVGEGENGLLGEALENSSQKLRLKPG